MFDVQKLLGQMVSGGVKHKKQRSGGFGIPGVSNAQLGIGAIGLAIAAWEHFKTKPAASAPAYGGAPTPPPMTPPPPPMAMPAPSIPAPPPPAMPVPAGSQEDARVADAAHLIRSMIAAANADGQIDAEERAGILERALEAGLDAGTQQFLMGELRAPATLDQIVASTRPELRLETYAAALLAIQVDSDAERAWLDRLAAALGLSAEDRQRVQEQLQQG